MKAKIKLKLMVTANCKPRLLVYLSEEKLNGCYIDFGIVKGTTKACSSYTGNCFVENELGEILDGLWEELESMGIVKRKNEAPNAFPGNNRFTPDPKF